MGSRGSVIPLFMELKGTGKLPITDERMTRFMISCLKLFALFGMRSVTRKGEKFMSKNSFN